MPVTATKTREEELQENKAEHSPRQGKFKISKIAHCIRCNGSGKLHMDPCPVCEGHGHLEVDQINDLRDLALLTPIEEKRMEVLKEKRDKTDAERAELKDLEDQLERQEQADKDNRRMEELREKEGISVEEQDELRDLEEKNR